jgi:hypothetical protein
MRARPLLALLLLWGCGQESELSPHDKAAQDGRDIAMVEDAQNINPPLQPIHLQPILYADLEKDGLFGASCAFMPHADNGGITALAREGAGWLKLDGRLHKLAADKGSGKLPFGAFSRYDGRELAIELTLENTEPMSSTAEEIDRRGAMIIRDAYARPVYKAKGMVYCSS